MSRPHIVGIGILTLLLLAAACSSSKEDYVARGDRFRSAGRLADAEINYRKAIAKDPAYGLAYYRLGLLQLSRRDVGGAYRALNSAHTYLRDNQDVKVKLGDLVLSIYAADVKRPQQFHAEVSQLADELLASNIDSVDGLRLKGTLAAIDRNPTEAAGLLQRADALKPGNPEVILPLAGVLSETGQGKSAEEMVQALMAKDKTVTRAYDFLYLRYIQTGRADEATEVLKLKAANNPNSAQWLIDLANRYHAVGQESQALATLEKITSDAKRFPDGHLIVGRYYLATNRMQDAIDQFQAGLPKDPARQAEYKRGIATAQRGLRKLDDALNTINSILSANPSDLVALEMKAEILAEKGDVDGALAVYRELVKSKGNDSTVRYEYGRLLALKGDSQAMREFQEAIRLGPSSMVPRLALAAEYIRRGLFKEASQATNEALALQPTEPRARLLHAISLAGEGVRDRARAELAQIARDSPLAAEANFQIAVLDIREKRFTEARQILEKLYKPGTSDLRALRGLLAVSLDENQFNEAVRLLQNELKIKPTDEVQYLLAETMIAGGKMDEGIALLEQLRTKATRSESLAFRLGDLYRKKGDWPKALSSFQQAAAIKPTDPVPYGLAGYVYQSMGNRAEAISNYRQSVKYENNNPQILNNLAFLLADGDQSLDEALQLAQRAVKADPGNPDYADTLGWIYLKKNLAPSAVQALQSAARKAPEKSILHYHLAVALLKTGDRGQAQQELKTALAQHPAPEYEEKIRKLMAEAGVPAR